MAASFPHSLGQKIPLDEDFGDKPMDQTPRIHETDLNRLPTANWAPMHPGPFVTMDEALSERPDLLAILKRVLPGGAA